MVHEKLESATWLGAPLDSSSSSGSSSICRLLRFNLFQFDIVTSPQGPQTQQVRELNVQRRQANISISVLHMTPAWDVKAGIHIC